MIMVQTSHLMRLTMNTAVFYREGNIPDISESGSTTEFLIDIHKKYGPITSFWLGPTQVVSLASPELIKQVVHLFDRPGKSSQAGVRP